MDQEGDDAEDAGVTKDELLLDLEAGSEPVLEAVADDAEHAW